MRNRHVALLVTLTTTPAHAEIPRTFAGKVLPFQNIAAVRNYGFKNGLVPAQVAISVQGGSQADWLATAAYVAEQSIVNDVTFSTVEVYVPSPWGDTAPIRVKQLAKAYYSGPDPQRSPWPDESWTIMAQGHAPTRPDVEFDALSNNLLGQAELSDDPDKQSEKANEAARRIIVRKYHLPKDWKPDEHVGAMDSGAVTVKREQIIVSGAQDAGASVAALRVCLSKDYPATLWRGCQDTSADYRLQETP